MSKGIKFFGLVLLVELLVCGFLYFQRSQMPTPPMPNLAIENSINRAAIEAEMASVKSPADWHRLASVFMASGFFAEGEAAYNQACELDPDSAEFAFDYGFCLARIGKWEASNEKFLRAIELKHPQTVQAMFFIGRNYLRGEDPENAKASFKKAIKIPLSKFELAKILYRQDQLDEAEELLKEVVRSEPGTVQTFVLRSQVALKKGNRLDSLSLSIEAAGKWLRLKSPFGDERNKLMETFGSFGYEELFRESSAQMNKRQHLEARRGFKALQESEWNFTVQDAWIKMATFTGRMSETKKLIQERIDRFGPTTASMEQLAEVHTRLGEYDEAIACWIRGGELNSDRQTRECYKNLASYYLETIDDEKTSQVYQAKGLIFYGFEGLSFDEFEKVLPMSTMATRYAPESVDAHFMLGRVKLGMAKYDEAEEAFKKCLELDPTYGRALRYLEAMESSTALLPGQ